MVDLEYDGTTIRWASLGKTYKASSGFPPRLIKPNEISEDYRNSKFQNVPLGPLPEGTYEMRVFLNGTAPVGIIDHANGRGGPDDTYPDIYAARTLDRSGIQQIPSDVVDPRTKLSYNYRGSWGFQIIRLFKTNNVKSNRDNFYLHDSKKGYSHGCIEAETTLFDDLKSELIFKHANKPFTLLLNIKYPTSSSSTYGETDK